MPVLLKNVDCSSLQYWSLEGYEIYTLKLFLKKRKYMLHVILGFLAFGLGIIGILLISKAFFSDESSEKQAISVGWIGIALVFVMGLILIYFYSLNPVSERAIKAFQEMSKQTLPDISVLNFE